MAELNARIIAKASATAAEEPLTGDLEVAELAVNTADGKLFTKHTDGSIVTISGGGGGAVDSVNSETGVVSLGIQDMDDFELLSTPGVGWQFDVIDFNDSASGLEDGKSFIDTTNVSISPVTDDGQDIGAALAAWVSATSLSSVDQDVVFTVNGVDYTVTVTAIGDFLNDTGSFSPRLRLSCGLQAQSGAAIGSTLRVKSFNEWAELNGYVDTGSPKAPLADGDILQWVSADQKFKPAQLPAGGSGAVDSVNGETGAVSLGIQDMDDFELANPPGSITWSTFISSITPPSENWSKSSLWLYVSIESDGPVDRTTELTTLAAGDFITVTDSTGYTVTEEVSAVVPDIVSQGGTHDRVQIQFTNYSTWASAVNTTGSITIESTVFSTGELPLAEGNVLRWNGTDQKFNPAQQEIQSMDDFELSQAERTATFAGPINSAPRSSDEWFANTTTSSYFVWWTGSANDTRMQTLEIGDAVTFTFDGGAELTTTVDHPGVSDAGDEQWFPVADTWPAEAGSATECVVSSPRFLTVPAQDIPLADGDILQWNDTDQKFKPAQLPAGGSGAVDSVNGETGVVSLGIQEMDDFELVHLGSVKTWVYQATQTNAPTAGEISNWSGVNWAMSTTDSDSEDVQSVLYALDSDQAVTVFVDGTEVYNGTAGTWGNKNSGRITFTFGDDSWKSSLAGGEVIGLSLAVFDPVDQPLTDGDILQWNNADQKFKPAQLPVDSVNGETGAVSLGIQDMDDFTLNQSFESRQFTGTSAGTPGNGELTGSGPFTNFPPYFQRCNISKFNADGSTNSVVAELVSKKATSRDAVTSENLVDILVDIGGDQYTVSVYCVSEFAAFIQMEAQPGTGLNPADLTTSPAWWPFDSGFNSADDVALIAPNTPIGVPLTDGDILQWDDTDQKFKPAQLPAGGSGAVDSVNGETGVVSLGIQDMDDYELRSEEASLPYNSYISGGNIPSAGEWLINQFYLYLPKVDSNGVDQSANLRALAGETLTITDSDGTVFTMTNISIAGDELDDANERILLSSPDDGSIDGSINKTGGITIDSTAFTGSVFPLAEGDILQWNNASQKFKPAQLPAGGGGGKDRIQDMDDFRKNQIPFSFYRYAHVGTENADWDTVGGSAVSDPTTIVFNAEDSDGKTDLSVQAQQAIDDQGSTVTFYLSRDLGATWTTYTSTSITPSWVSGATFIGSVSPSITDTSSEVRVSFTDPTGASFPLAEGNILQWNNIDQVFNPAQLPDATATRVLLGIGEYVDDAAAGTGGVASGAMYYNTTSSDYRLKS